MKTRIVLAFVALWLMADIQWLPAQGIEFVHDKKFQEILDMAKAQNKAVFMDCYTSWCGPCKRMSTMIFPDSTVGAYFNSNFINVKFDMEKDEGVDLANRYSIHAYPTLLWLDGDGHVKLQNVGAIDAYELVKDAKKAIDTTPLLLARMKADYAGGNREANFLGDYVHTLFISEEQYENVFKEYLGILSNNDFTNSKHSRIIFELTNDIKSPGVPYLIKNRDYYMRTLGVNTYKNKIYDIASKAADQAPINNDQATFDNAIKLVKESKTPDADAKILRLYMDYDAHMAKWEDYDKNASKYIKKYASNNAALLNDVAWDYFINVHSNSQLEKAVKWAYQAVNIDNKYTYNLTYAYLLYKLNNYKEAERACDYAILRAKAENVTPTSANGLKDAIKKSLDSSKVQ